MPERISGSVSKYSIIDLPKLKIRYDAISTGFTGHLQASILSNQDGRNRNLMLPMHFSKTKANPINYQLALNLNAIAIQVHILDKVDATQGRDTKYSVE